jgi:hypothetical protein
VPATVVGLAGVLGANAGSGHALTGDVTGTLFLYGIVVGTIAMLG